MDFSADFAGSNASCPGSDEHTRKLLLIIRCSVAGASIVGCVLVLLVVLCFMYLESIVRLTTLRLVLYITGSSIFRSAIIVAQISFISDSGYSSFAHCVSIGYLYHNATFMVILFTLMATVHVFLTTFKFYTRELSKKFERVSILVSLILPFTFTWIPFAYDSSVLEAWCSIRTNDTCKQHLMGFIFNDDLPRFVIEMINTILIFAVFARIPAVYRKMKQQEEKFHIWFLQVLPFLIYSVLYLIVNWFSLTDHVNRIFNIVDDSHTLRYIHAITSAARGLVVGVSFSTYFIIMVYIVKHKNNGGLDDGEDSTYSNTRSYISISSNSGCSSDSERLLDRSGASGQAVQVTA